MTSEQIHEVFSLYNKQGKHLNAEEIRNALFHHLALMRGLLVTAGDSSRRGCGGALPRGRTGTDLESTSRTLDRYGFQAAGYKRTKILSWVGSILAHGDGRLESRSTATHVNGLLERVAANRADKLRNEGAVRDLMLLLDHGLDAHALVPREVWTQKFVNSQSRGKWQELQLVASLAGLSAAYEFHGDELPDLIEDRYDQISALSASKEWQRPDKTQSREQWQYIADVVGGLLTLFEVPDEEVEASLRDKFGNGSGQSQRPAWSAVGAILMVQQPPPHGGSLVSRFPPQGEGPSWWAVYSSALGSAGLPRKLGGPSARTQTTSWIGA